MAETAPDVFEADASGQIYFVKEGPRHFTDANPNLAAQKTGAHLAGDGRARIPIRLLDDVIEAADLCPGECIFFDPVA